MVKKQGVVGWHPTPTALTWHQLESSSVALNWSVSKVQKAMEVSLRVKTFRTTAIEVQNEM